MRQSILACALVALSMTLATEARAQQPAAEATHASATASVAVGARVGAIAPQPFNELGSFAIGGVEAGFILPALQRRLRVNAAFLYSQPPASGGGDDMRLSGGSYDWDLDQQMIILELSGVYHLVAPGSGMVPFVRAGGRVYMLDTGLGGASGEAAAFGTHQEAFTEVGFVLGGGVDLAVGPGTLVGEVDLGFSDMNEQLTGDANTGAFELTAGYRMYF